jgi:HSP20 family molecular chaperone IbpA
MNDVKTTENTKKALPRFRPAADIIEREDGFHVFLDMPGVRKEDLTIDLDENRLAITGPTQPVSAGEKIHEAEFVQGEYHRSFTLSDTVDRGRIKASLENGVLELFLPKVEEVKPKRIEIQAG